MADYYELLSSLATDLDNMLSELCTTPPPPYDRLSDNELHNRQTKWDVSNSGVSLGHKGTILDSNNHKLDGSGYASKNFESHGLKPDQFGGRLDYTHKSSGSNAFVGADHTRNFGTDVKAGAQYNILHSKNADLGVVGQYQRHFGGPSGTGKPQGQATKWGISNTGVGASHSGTIFDNNNHRLDGSAYAAKNFGSHGLRPDQFGGRLDYAHKPSGSGAFLSADNTRHFGTDVNAGAQYNFVHKKNLDVGVVGQYGRHFGGPFGTGRPQGYVGLTATGRF